MEDMQYVNLIKIGPVVIEIQGVKNGKLAVSINNTLVCHTAFLAADTDTIVFILKIVLVTVIQYHNNVTVAD